MIKENLDKRKIYFPVLKEIKKIHLQNRDVKIYWTLSEAGSPSKTLLNRALGKLGTDSKIRVASIFQFISGYVKGDIGNIKYHLFRCTGFGDSFILILDDGTDLKNDCITFCIE